MPNPKSEIRNPKQIRISNRTNQERIRDFGFGHSIFEFVWDFGFRISSFFLAVLAASALSPAKAASPHEELLRRTPPEVSFCLAARDVRDHFAAVSSGPLAKAFRESKLGQTIAATPEAKQLEQLGRQVSFQLGVEWPRIRDEIFGDAVVFAYQNGPPGKPEEERGLLLTWARDPKLVRQILERLDAAQKQSGELKETKGNSYRGKSYVRRVKSKGPDDFFFLSGSIIAFSQQEAIIRRVIELDESVSASPAPPSAFAKTVEQLNDAATFAVLQINPRNFDADLDQKLRNAAGQDEAFLKTFRSCWSALDGVTVAVRLERHLELRLNLDARPEELPPGLRRFLKTLGEPSALWSVFPENPMFALAARIDLAALVETFAEFMTPESRQSVKGSLEQSFGMAFGRSALQLLPSYLGPDVGICVTAPPAGTNKKRPIPDVLFALGIGSGKERERVEQSISDAMDVLITLLRAGHNTKQPEPIRVRTERQGGVEIKYLTHESFPAGFQPAYALKDGFFFLATSPEVIRRTRPADSQTPAANRILSVSLRQLDKFLKENHDDLVGLMTAKGETSKEEANKQLEKIHMGLELFDRVEIFREAVSPAQAKLSLRVQFTAPLR
jgi:hypothetical protein